MKPWRVICSSTYAWRPSYVAARGVVLRRRLDQASHHGGFGNIEIARMLVKVALRSRLDAVALVPVVHLVQVHLQDLVLGQLLVQLVGQDDLARFARQGDLFALLG
jgi:hypothetical protein